MANNADKLYLETLDFEYQTIPSGGHIHFPINSRRKFLMIFNDSIYYLGVSTQLATTLTTGFRLPAGMTMSIDECKGEIFIRHPAAASIQVGYIQVLE